MFLSLPTRYAKLKRRPNQFNEDGENQNPNLSTPPISRTKSTKAAIKSSSEKKKAVDDNLQNQELPRLKSTLSARNLYVGRVDILGHITEFCNELKKLATRARDNESNKGKTSQVGEKNEVVRKEEAASCDVLGEVDVREKEKKPLLEVAEEKPCEGMENTSAKEKPRRKK